MKYISCLEICVICDQTSSGCLRLISPRLYLSFQECFSARAPSRHFYNRFEVSQMTAVAYDEYSAKTKQSKITTHAHLYTKTY